MAALDTVLAPVLADIEISAGLIRAAALVLKYVDLLDMSGDPVTATPAVRAAMAVLQGYSKKMRDVASQDEQQIATELKRVYAVLKQLRQAAKLGAYDTILLSTFCVWVSETSTQRLSLLVNPKPDIVHAGVSETDRFFIGGLSPFENPGKEDLDAPDPDSKANLCLHKHSCSLKRSYVQQVTARWSCCRFV